MKTTLIIDDAVAAELKREAQRRQTTVSAIVEDAVRAYFTRRKAKPSGLPDLPSFDGGGCAVDVADRDALYRAMEGR